MSLAQELNKLINLVLANLDPRDLWDSKLGSTVTANIICKNNSKSILFCLSSLIDSVDEVIVIDTGSTDQTQRIVRDFLNKEQIPFKLIQEPEFKGYSYHRNQAIKESQGDWILVIDSDEFLSQELSQLIPKLVKSKYYAGYKFFRRWIQKINSDTIEYISTKQFKGRYKSNLRVFRKSPITQYRGEIHEAIFGLERKRMDLISEEMGCIYHLDVAINDKASREQKVKNRENLKPGSGHPEEYLPENYKIESIVIKKPWILECSNPSNILTDS